MSDKAEIEISGRPCLQATSQHGAEPDWRTTPAQHWPFAWEAQMETDGVTLVFTSRGESAHRSHRYLLEEVTISVPPGVAVLARRKELRLETN